jgi:hypothetical protein
MISNAWGNIALRDGDLQAVVRLLAEWHEGGM